MDIDFIFDAACPWSYIGKHRMDQALAERPTVVPRINWVPFLLNPEIPEGGMNRRAFMTNKFGSDSRIKRMHDTLTEAGKKAGISFNFDLMEKIPNTVAAHRVIQMANTKDKGNIVAERIFRGYFAEGLDIGDPSILLDISERSGLDAGDIARRLLSDEFSEFVQSENSRAHRLGINGVPSFAFSGSMIISGAQTSKVLTRVIDAAVAEIKIARTQASFS